MYCDDLKTYGCQVNMNFHLVALYVITEIKPTKLYVVREKPIIFYN